MSNFSKAIYRYRGFILAALAIALLITPAAPLPYRTPDDHDITVIAALLLFLLGAALRIRTRQFIGDHTRGSVHQADTLVTWGPYAYVRHPLYVSNILVSISIVFFHLGPRPALIPFCVIVIAFEWALSIIEDRFLHKKFGKDWETWAKDVEALNFGAKLFLRKGTKRLKADSRSKKPVRTIWQSFWADRSTWAWLMFYNLLLVLKRIYLT